jgi:ATP-dependent exoDNAse (exonuclease V) beta subunit
VQSFSDFYDKSRSLLPRLNFEKINLEMSYRSDKNIINFVNNFTQIESIKNLSNISNSAHQYLDSKELGGVFVELYDFKNKDKPEQELLDVADEIAIRIKSIIEKNTDKSIMILKKNRGEKWHKIIYKLQEFGFIIKTDGVDDNLKLCLMDILSILKIANRSISQYEITGLLKSPIFKFNDGDLLKIINSGNGFSIIKDEIWKNVNQSNNEIVQVIFKKLGEDFLVFESTIEAVLKIYANKIISLSLNDFYGKPCMLI